MTVELLNITDFWRIGNLEFTFLIVRHISDWIINNIEDEEEWHSGEGEWPSSGSCDLVRLPCDSLLVTQAGTW